MTRLVVTGASGFIGRHVLMRAPRDWEIVAVFHRTPLDAFVRQAGLTGVRTVQCDLTDPVSVAALGASIGRADAVLHLAANGDPARSVERPAWDLQSNTGALVTVLEHCEADHLVYVSSGAVYDGIRGAVSPATPVAPRLPYAIAKLASEHYVRSFSERRGMPASYINVRFFGAYGPYEPPRKITTKWLSAIAAGAREFTIRGSGENLIDFMYIDDAVDGLLKLVDAHGTSLTLDFASGSPITINQLAETMAGVLDVPVRVRHEGHTEEFIEFHTVDSTMRERFGVTPKIAFEDGLRRLSRFLQLPAENRRAAPDTA